MNRQLFYQYLENPHSLNEESLKHLNELMAAYPYFQPGRMLLVKNLANRGHIAYNLELKKAAAHISDRRQLYFLVNPPLPEAKPLANSNETPIGTTESQAAPIAVDSAIDVPPTTPTEQPIPDPQPETLAILASEDKQPTDNYFEVSDVIDLENGTSIDFSLTTRTAPQPEPDVLPAADLLDYETVSAPYQLGDLEENTFDATKTQPFSAWLKAMRHPVPQTSNHEKGGAPIDRQMQIIESFLQKSRDRIVPDKATQLIENKDISEQSVRESDALMTETLANIHIKQKQYQKAITIFEKLGLKYPEKSIYFAARIQDLERLITNP